MAALPSSAPVALDAVADFGSGATIVLDHVKPIDAVAAGPGEVSGPALALTFTMTNRSSTALGLESVTVDVTDAIGDPGIAMFGDPAQPFQGSLAVGATATATYVFAVDPAARSPIRVEVNYSTGAPTVVLVGDAATGS